MTLYPVRAGRSAGPHAAILYGPASSRWKTGSCRPRCRRASGGAGRHRPVEPDGDGVRPRRPAVRRRAGRDAAGHQERRLCGRRLRSTRLDGQRDGRARAAGRRLRPQLRRQRFVYVYYTATTPAIHNRVSRFTANAAGDLAVAGQRDGLLDLEQPQRRHQPQRRRDPLRPRRQALRRRRRQRQRRTMPRRSSNLLGKILRINADGTDPRRQPLLRHRRPGNNRAIWALGLRNPFTFAFQPGTGRCSSTTWARTPGRRSTTASPGPTTAGRPPRGLPTNPRFRATRPFATPTTASSRAARSPAARSTTPRPPVPGRLRRRLLLRRLLQRLDPAARPGDRARSTDFATGICQPGRPAGRRRRQPLLPGPAAPGAGLPRPVHGQPGARASPSAPASQTVSRRPVGDLHASPPPGRRRCTTSGSATAATSPAPPRPSYTIASAHGRRTTARGSAPW